jgi:large subunit ribosomal protein L25
MAEKITAEARENFGKGAARKLRATGKIPAVLYGHGTDPVHVALPGHEVSLIIRKANAVLDIDLAGKPLLALIKDVQKDPVRQIIEHVDLLLVRQGEKVQVEVPVHVEGESFAGTVAEMNAQTLLLEVEATNIPQRVVIDIEGAVAGTQFLAGDLKLPEGAVLASPAELLVIGVAEAAAEEAAENAAAAPVAAAAE